MGILIFISVVLLIYKVSKWLKQIQYEEMVYNYKKEVEEEYRGYVRRRLKEMQRNSSMSGLSYGFYNNYSMLKNFKLRLESRKVKSRYHLRMDMR